MIFNFLGKLKYIAVSIFLVFFLTSCSYKNPINGTNNFHSLVSKLVDESSSKIKQNVSPQDVILVSDFVNPINTVKCDSIPYLKVSVSDSENCVAPKIVFSSPNIVVPSGPD